MEEDDDISSQLPTPILRNAARRVGDSQGLEDNLSPSRGIKLDQIPPASNVTSLRNWPDLAVENTPPIAHPDQSRDAQKVTEHHSYYPKSISPEKLDKALQLYNKYMLASAPDEPSVSAIQDGFLLRPEQSERDETSAPLSLAHNNGARIEVRSRKALSQSARAQAALMRYLGSCQTCRSRRVRCPLEHHDIATLKRLSLEKAKGDREQRATTSAFDWDDPDEPPHRAYIINVDRIDTILAFPESRQHTSTVPRHDSDGATATRLHPDSTISESATKCYLCIVFFLFWFVIIAGSISIGFWRSIVTSDEGKGFTDAAYVVAVGGVILYPVQNRHSRRCKAASNEMPGSQ